MALGDVINASVYWPARSRFSKAVQVSPPGAVEAESPRRGRPRPHRLPGRRADRAGRGLRSGRAPV